jgi:ribosomal protein L32
MGAVPKNKVTRVEQGKRRAGNKAQVKKDPKVSKTPMHKQGFVASIFKNLGIK